MSTQGYKVSGQSQYTVDIVRESFCGVFISIGKGQNNFATDGQSASQSVCLGIEPLWES
jgi:hypothetical protein